MDAGASLQQLTANFVKIWWRLESFLERWNRSVSCGYDDPTEPRQYHGGYGNTHQAPPRGWVAGAILVSAMLIAGALWHLSSRIASLEAKVAQLTSEPNLGIEK